MVTDFPINTIFFIVAALMATGVAAWFTLMEGMNRLAIAARVKQNWRWGIALVLITWLLARLIVGLLLPVDVILGVPLIVTFTSLGLLAGMLPLVISPVFRQSIRAIPPTWLIGLHTLRMLGFAFLALLDMKLLPAEFALAAGYGDILVALLAVGVVYLLAQRAPYARALAIGWHALGLLDFVTALVTGLLYIRPFAAQLAANGVSLTYLTYMLIVPAFGVPLFTLIHFYSLFQLFSAQPEAAKQFGNAVVQHVVAID